jgi:ribosomal protein L30/L7E
MNKEKINKTFFEDLHQLQMNQINTSELKQARKVILGLLAHVSGYDKYNPRQTDEAVLGALKWLKNNQS